MRFILTYILLVVPFILTAQIQTNELPPSYQLRGDKSIHSSNIITLSPPDISSLKAVDATEDRISEIPWRFGTIINSNITTHNSGQWLEDDNGNSIWKVTIEAKDAISLNLNFNDFHLSNNAKLYFYNASYTDVIGAVTAANNKDDNLFSIRPILGETLSLELIVPTAEKTSNRISINQVVYGYRSLKNKINKVFQSSGSCNVNINCSDGAIWQEIKRSVAIITTASNTRFCTGALVNNVQQDTVPFFLSAAHCGIQNNSIFIFNYESPNCTPNTDGTLTNSISGASRKAIAVNQGTDFVLYELSSRPPASYNVFYAGWSAINTPSTKSTCIHHPSGDVKKISIDNGTTTTSGYYSTGTTHWTVANWESGTTEGGSSGAPLFDANQRIIGQLHGGDAACTNKAQDYFGKFAVSWNGSPDTLRQLKHWLDPNNTGTTVIDGLDPNPATNNFDLQLINIGSIDEHQCVASIQPIVSVRNIGNNAIDSLYIDYSIGNGTVQSILSVVNLQRNQLAHITIPSTAVLNGVNTFNAVARIAGSNIDQDSTNNSLSFSFHATLPANSFNIVMHLRTDSDGAETSWDIVDTSTNRILHRSRPYPSLSGGALYTDTLCVYTNCFQFNLYDSFGDGFNNGRGNGYALLTNLNNDTLLLINNFTASIRTANFCANNVTSLPSYTGDATQIISYPNPIKKGERLFIKSERPYTLKLFDSKGREVLTNYGIEISIPKEISSGLYFLEISDQRIGKRIDTKKVLVK